MKPEKLACGGMLGKRSFRITYMHDDKSAQYYIAAENSTWAIMDFALRTGNARESIVLVEVQDGRKWVKLK